MSDWREIPASPIPVPFWVRSAASGRGWAQPERKGWGILAGMAHDLIIRGGTVLDGTGAEATSADVAVDGDRITAIGDLTGVEATREIDASGLTVSPGLRRPPHPPRRPDRVGPVHDLQLVARRDHHADRQLRDVLRPRRPRQRGVPGRDDGERRGHPPRRHPRRDPVGLDHPPAVPRLGPAPATRRSTSSASSATARSATR